MITIEVYTAEYAPWEEGADEREKISEWTDTLNPRLWAAIVASVSRQWTHYTGPYYVERTNVFGVKL